MGPSLFSTSSPHRRPLSSARNIESPRVLAITLEKIAYIPRLTRVLYRYIATPHGSLIRYEM